MNNNILLIAAAIVAAVVIVKLPFGPQPGRYQMASASFGMFRVDTTTGATWQWYGGTSGWNLVANGDR
jgi:hypothetical protein